MHGSPIDRHLLPGYRLVVSLQNHDQIGNRAVGDRLSELTDPARQRLAALLLLTAPFTPMLFMGEEWAASTRWPYFTSHTDPGLADIGEHRKQEFGSHGWNTDQMIDPQDPRAFHDAILRWDERDESDHAQVLKLYIALIALRHAEPDLADPRLDLVEVDFDEDQQWITVQRGSLLIVANLARSPQTIAAYGSDVLIATGTAKLTAGGVELGPETGAVVRRLWPETRPPQPS
jgi:maltooligosyltrehalose trehalohydrolase